MLTSGGAEIRLNASSQELRIAIVSGERSVGSSHGPTEVKNWTQVSLFEIRLSSSRIVIHTTFHDWNGEEN